jgi:hypothetical protein
MDKRFDPSLTDSQRLLMIEAMTNTIQTRVLELDSTTERHNKILVEGQGNDLPLQERVRNLEAYANSLKFWLRTVAVAIVLQTITFGVASVIYFIRLLPLLDQLANKP